VGNGPLAGASLAEVCRRFGAELVGEVTADKTRFPLLIKFLFPREKLSVQVHPDDESARRIGQPCGKTECWYVLAAEKGTQVGLGLKPGTTLAQFEEAIAQTRAEELLNWIDIHPGELIYVDAGTVHTIGPGSILVETQQNSDTTYRLYDYGRPRELHVREGLLATKEKTHAGKVKPSARALNGHWRLVSSPCFEIDKLKLHEPKSFKAARTSSATILVALDGCGAVESAASQPVTFARGDAVVVPASTDEFSVRPQWQVEFLHISLPGGTAAHPATTLT
jgi:mannose-6-phosphate isomerase